MKDTKTAHVSFAFYDRANLEKYLEEQAAEGWLIETYAQNFIKFRRIRPEKLHFSIIYYHSPVTINCLTNEQLEYLEFCARTGWYLVTAERRMLILANREEHPIPIETDPKMQLENIHKSVKKQHIRYMMMCIAIGLLDLAMASGMGIVSLFASPHPTPLLVMGVWYCAQGLPDIIGYYIWRRKAKAAADEGTFYNDISSNVLFYITMLLVYVLASALLVILSYGISPVLNGIIIANIAIGALCGLWCLLQRGLSKISSGVCRHIVTIGMALFLIFTILIQAIFAGVHHYNHSYGSALAKASDMPMSVTELTETDFDDYITRKYSTGSLLLTQDEYRQKSLNSDANLPELYYTITYIHADFLYSACQKDLLKDFARRGEAITVDASGWNADAAYQLYAYGSIQYDYLLCYDGHIVEILFDWEPTAEQMAIVGQKLSQIK